MKKTFAIIVAGLFFFNINLKAQDNIGGLYVDGVMTEKVDCWGGVKEIYFVYPILPNYFKYDKVQFFFIGTEYADKSNPFVWTKEPFNTTWEGKASGFLDLTSELTERKKNMYGTWIDVKNGEYIKHTEGEVHYENWQVTVMGYMIKSTERIEDSNGNAEYVPNYDNGTILYTSNRIQIKQTYVAQPAKIKEDKNGDLKYNFAKLETCPASGKKVKLDLEGNKVTYIK
jgi:hypothetical protein